MVSLLLLLMLQVGSNFEARYVNFASPRIADMLLGKLTGELKDELQQFLVATEDQPIWQ